MHNFYLKLLSSACTKCCISWESIPNHDAIIMQALDELSPDDKHFIEMLKPPHLAYDPHGVYTKQYTRQVSEAFQLPFSKIGKRRKKIEANLFRKMVFILSKNYE